MGERREVIPRETFCKQCGEKIYLRFYNASEYVYKIKTPNGTFYFCNWNCMRKYQRAHNILPEREKLIKEVSRDV